ncbi:MAG: hypothetical protein JST49_01670 [Bacteroidetes bacterium]|nr:hypothetical protein [Bacteroidota bacterium]
MKKLISYAFMLGAALPIMAQTTTIDKFKVTFGSEFELPKKHWDLGIIGSKEDGIVQLSYQPGKDLSMQRFDSKLSVSKTDVADISKMPASFMNDQFTKLGDKYFWFFSTWDKKAEKEHLNIQQIDVKTGKAVGQSRDLITVSKLEGTSPYGGFMMIATQKSGKFQFVKSKDDKIMLVTYRLLHTSRDDSKSKETVGFNVFDENAKKMWSKEVTMPYPEEMMSIKDYATDKNGNAFLLMKVYDGAKKEKDKKGNRGYHYEVMKVTPSGDVKNLKLGTEKYYVNEIRIIDNEQGDLYCTGYYSNNAKSSSDGVFTLKIGQDNRISPINKGYYEFPSEVLKEFISARAKRKLEEKEKDEDIEASNLKIKQILYNADGSIVVAGEEAFVIWRMYMTNAGPRFRYDYYYKDILAIKISAAGEVEWCRKIPKRQKGTSTVLFTGEDFVLGNMSYEMFEYEGDYYFLYTDNVKNLALAKDKEPAYHISGAGGFLVYAKIEKDGAVSKGKFFDYREKKMNLNPDDFVRISENQILNRAYDGRRSKALLVTFP